MSPRSALSRRRHRSTVLLVLSLLPIAAIAGDEPEDVLLLGAGVAAGPRFPGSAKYVAAPLLMLDYRRTDGFFASTSRGLGWEIEGERFGASAALAYRGGRSDKEQRGLRGGSTKAGNELRGMGEIKGSATAVLSASYKPLPMLALNATAELPLSQRDNGNAYQLGAALTLPAAQRHEFSLGLALSGGDAKYLQTYFGVNATQSRNAGLAAFRPRAGLHSVEASVNWSFRLNERWTLMHSLGAMQLIGDAADSPLVRRKRAAQGSLLFSYRY